MPDILHLLPIEAAPPKVFEALSTAEGVRSWWTRDADLGTRVGDQGEFRFPEYGPHAVTRVRIEALDAPSRVEWACASSFHAEWHGTKISFALKPRDGGTSLFFAHRGYPRADETFALFKMGWAYYLVSLKRYVETGTGAPSPDIDFFQMIA
jgi:uncharacterized protein YndB with AHSA1/START domain